jgi:hypothetical protein
MSKTYNYKNLSFPIEDGKKVFLIVKYISDGNSSHTVINKPGHNDPELEDQGKVLIDLSNNLRDETTYVVTALDNFIPDEDTITLEYYLNELLIQRHSNLKSVTESPMIILHINFPKK